LRHVDPARIAAPRSTTDDSGVTAPVPVVVVVGVMGDASIMLNTTPSSTPHLATTPSTSFFGL